MRKIPEKRLGVINTNPKQQASKDDEKPFDLACNLDTSPDNEPNQLLGLDADRSRARFIPRWRYEGIPTMFNHQTSSQPLHTLAALVPRG